LPLTRAGPDRTSPLLLAGEPMVHGYPGRPREPPASVAGLSDAPRATNRPRPGLRWRRAYRALWARLEDVEKLEDVAKLVRPTQAVSAGQWRHPLRFVRYDQSRVEKIFRRFAITVMPCDQLR
jgi:hypothetical protein